MNLEERRMDERESFAIKNMKLLWLSDNVIENFKNGKIFFFGITGYPEELYKDSYCYKQVSLFESKYNSKVYAVIYSDLGFGACYSFLYIPGYKEDWQYLLMPGDGLRRFYCQAYVWNRSFPELSEFGNITVYAPGKQLKRLF